MSTLQVEHVTRQDGKAVVYRLRGVLGESLYSYDFLEEVRRQVREGPPGIVLDLARLEYVTSSGIGVIAAVFTSARRAGKAFALVAVPKPVRRVLEISSLSTLIPSYATEEEACEAF